MVTMRQRECKVEAAVWPSMIFLNDLKGWVDMSAYVFMFLCLHGPEFSGFWKDPSKLEKHKI